ncbi:MAG: hypothetical protein SOU51_01155 [Collinsella sp.]|nr:hypothetical protein [Collinsella sp.]
MDGAISHAAELLGEETVEQIIVKAAWEWSSNTSRDALERVITLEKRVDVIWGPGDYREENAMSSCLMDYLGELGLAERASDTLCIPIEDLKPDDLLAFVTNEIEESYLEMNLPYLQEFLCSIEMGVRDGMAEALKQGGPPLQELAEDIEDLDPDSIHRWLDEHYPISVSFGVDEHARKLDEVPVTILLSGDRDYEMTSMRHVSSSANVFLDGGARSFIDREFIGEDGRFRVPAWCANNALSWLCESQGTTLSSVVNGDDHSDFAESLRTEIIEASAAVEVYPTLEIMATTSYADALALAAASRGLGYAESTFSPDLSLVAPGGDDAPVLGIVCNVCGAGGLLEIRLDRPLPIRAENVARVLPGPAFGTRRQKVASLYTPECIFGLDSGAWRGELKELKSGQTIEAGAVESERAAISSPPSTGRRMGR